MTVSSPVSRIVHLTHEAVSDYTFPFKVFKAGELAVDLVDASFRVMRLELGVDFAVTGLGLDQGGTITLTVAGMEKAGTGLALVMLRRMDFTQETDYRPHDIFPAETHERALDILTMICQELREMIGRAMIAPPNLDKPIQYSDFVALLNGALAAWEEAQAEADRAEAAAGNAAEEVRGELAGLVAAAETAQSLAEKAKTQARGAATLAKNQAALARRWASNPEDVEVRPGLFSARHYAARAAQSAQSLDLPDLSEAAPGQVLTAVEQEDGGLGLEYADIPEADLQPLWDALDTKLDAADYSGFPSDTYDTLAWPAAQNGTVTMPEDGFIRASATATASNGYIHVNSINSAGRILLGQYSVASSATSYLAVNLPLSKGQRLQINWSAINNPALTFVPALRAPGL